MKTPCLVVLLGFVATAFAQQPNVANQREAMKKLDFLAGKWSGEALVSGGAGQVTKRIQTEDVQYKMNGLVMVIEGASRKESGEIVFQALATVSYDEASSTYRFRAYHDGAYIDTELKAMPNGFSWGYPAGAAKINNSMRLNESGEWMETTQMTGGTAPPRTLVEMRLRRMSRSGQPFDGQWLTTVSCDAARDALGYSFRFVSEVRDGYLRGLYGKEGEPSSLLIDGKVSEDGTGKLYATGRTGSKEFVPGRDAPRNTQYNYSIDAHFKDESGTGTRIEGRPCSFQFQKQ